MSRIGKTLDFYFQPVHVVYAFWSMYWGLNGLDKFFDGVGAPAGKACAFANGRATPCGWFGTSRHEQITAYFDKLGMGEWTGPVFLYPIAVFEVVLGILFLMMLVQSLWGRSDVSHSVHRFAFMGSIIVFFLFAVGDILFGDRVELWEHATFMVLIVVTFGVYVYRNQLREQALGDVYSRIETMDETINTRLYGDLMNRMDTMEAQFGGDPSPPKP